MVSGYNKDGILGYDSALDSSGGREVEIEGSGDWVQGLIRRT
jgi:hypothetical protein